MERYLQLRFINLKKDQMEILVALLADIGYEGFEEGDGELTASITEKNFNRKLTLETIPKGIVFNEEIIIQKNWNEEWEKSFEPVIVGRFCAVRAGFHNPVPGVEYDILITPRMSFGTGHHATTYLVLQTMQSLPVKGGTILDFGTGTGVLSILAAKMGASEVIAIDNDDWSIRNAKENIRENNCRSVIIKKADNLNTLPDFDIILANINKHVISANLIDIKQHLKLDGVVVLSGLLETDETDIMKMVESIKMEVHNIMRKDKWIAMIIKHVH